MLEGSVRRVDRRVRVSAQPIDKSDHTHLWADTYERSGADVFGVQSEIAQAIAEAVGIELSSDAVVARRHLPDADAHEYYLQGRFHWYKLSKVNCQTAIDYFQLALERDPLYAAAYAGIAAVWAVRGDCGFSPPALAYAEARTAAARASHLDESLAEVHDVLDRIAFYWDWDFHAAERAFRRAVALNPSYADVRLMLWDCLTSQGRLEEADAR